ncbi:MAG: hypothetical protein RLZZ408_1377 [Verrucomicrobiota bacterium]|jgi:hypothetical protein
MAETSFFSNPVATAHDQKTMLNLHQLISWNGTAPTSTHLNDQGWIQSFWTVPAGESFAATCRITLPETPKPFWCIPGVFWGDNQQDTTGQYYPRFRSGLEGPRRFESSFWEIHTWRATQPLAAVNDGSAWWILEVMPESAGLCASVGFEFDGGRPVLVASLPASERPYRNAGHDYTMPVTGSSIADHSREVTWSVRALRFEGDYKSILEFLQTNYHSREDRAFELPEADYAKVTRNALLNWHYHPNDHYFRYTVAFDRVGQQIAEAMGASLDRHEMALGWVSGWVVLEALIEYAVKCDDAEAMRAVEAVWKNLTDSGLISPSGFWWTRFAPSRGRKPGIFDSKSPDGFDGNWMCNPDHLHMRTLGDAIWRAARSLRRHGKALSFSGALQDQLVAQAIRVAGLARDGWPLPLSVGARTGKPAGLHGTASMIWISVWAELSAMDQWSDTDLIAQGLDHYRPAVESGHLFGAPEDVGECVTSEDIYIAVNAYLDGYRVTRRPVDLETAIQTARWLYTWRKSFNHSLDPKTIIGVYQLKSRGGDLASFKNNHLHIYGLDVEESLLELAALTGDHRWRDLADDHWRFSAQLTPLVDGHFNAYEGMVTEQFYFIDWSALGNSVRLFEQDERRSNYDVGPHYRNHGNLAGFSHSWCTAFVLRSALKRSKEISSRE